MAEQANKDYDLIILGGGVAGMTAGIYGGRAQLKTLILEQSQTGGQATLTNEIANYPGFMQITGFELAERMREQAQSFGAEIKMTSVKSVKLQGEYKEIETDDGFLRARTLVIATGAKPRNLGFEGEQEFRGKGVGYCATCDGFFYRGKEVFVIGGGFSAAEEALYLTRFARKVTIVVRKDKFRCAQSLIDKVMAEPKIEVWFNTELKRVYGDKKLQGAEFCNNSTGECWEYKVSEDDGKFGIFVFVGYQPVTELYQGQLELTDDGYIITDADMHTSVPGVFAAGDIRAKSLRQLVTAAADGAIAATQAEQYLTEH